MTDVGGISDFAILRREAGSGLSLHIWTDPSNFTPVKIWDLGESQIEPDYEQVIHMIFEETTWQFSLFKDPTYNDNDDWSTLSVNYARNNLFDLNRKPAFH